MRKLLIFLSFLAFATPAMGKNNKDNIHNNVHNNIHNTNTPASPNINVKSRIAVDASSVVNQNFEASEIPITLPNTAYVPSRDIQLYGQQGETPNVKSAFSELHARFIPKYYTKYEGDSGETRLVIVTSQKIKPFKSSIRKKGNEIVVISYPISNVLGTITIYPKDDGNRVDVNTLLHDVQVYLDDNYDGVFAVTQDSLLSSTYGVASHGGGRTLNPSSVVNPGNWIIGLAGGLNGNNASVRPVGYVGLTLFLTDKIDAPPVVAVKVPTAKKVHKISKGC